MRRIFASSVLMLVSVAALASENGPFRLQVVVDQDPIQEFSIYTSSYSSQELVLTEELRLSVTVNPLNSKNFESILYGKGEILHSAVQAKSADSDPNFYLVCAGKLAKFLSPLKGEAPTCPVPSA